MQLRICRSSVGLGRSHQQHVLEGFYVCGLPQLKLSSSVEPMKMAPNLHQAGGLLDKIVVEGCALGYGRCEDLVAFLIIKRQRLCEAIG